jgi:hypothetical protein
MNMVGYQVSSEPCQETTLARRTAPFRFVLNSVQRDALEDEEVFSCIGHIFIFRSLALSELIHATLNQIAVCLITFAA